MVDYKLPQKLRDTFAALYVTTEPLPYALDVKCKLYEICSKGERSSYLHQALSQLCLDIMNQRETFCSLTQISYPSPVFSETDKRTRDNCLEFFEIICDEFLKYEEAKSDDIVNHLRELAKYVIIFNDVIEMRINVVHHLFEDVFEYLCVYPSEKDFYAASCDCDTFHKSGDCACPIEDIVKNDMITDEGYL